MFDEIYEEAFSDELSKIARYGESESTRSMAAKAQKEEQGLKDLKKNFKGEYRTRNISGVIGAALGAVGGSRIKKMRVPGAIGGALVAGTGALAAAHAINKEIGRAHV